MDYYSESEDDLDRLRLKVSQLEEDWREIEDSWDHTGNIRDVEDDLFPLIISTHAAIEDISAHLILAFIVKEEFSERAWDYYYSGMSQSHREELLYQCGILSGQTRGKISHFKGLRNNLAHGTFMKLDWYRDDVPEKMNVAFEVLDLFEKAIVDGDFIDEIYRGNEKI